MHSTVRVPVRSATAPLESTEHRRVPDHWYGRELDGVEAGAHADVEAASAAAIPGSASDASARNGSKLPKRSPGASGVNNVVGPPDGRTAAVPVVADEEETARQSTPNTFAYFTTRSTPEGPPSQPVSAPATPPQSTPDAESASRNIESESAPIFERMMSEWLMDSTTRESRDGVWATAADAGWAAAAKAVEQKPVRHTESGLPIRERGARLVPGRVTGGFRGRRNGGP